MLWPLVSSFEVFKENDAGDVEAENAAEARTAASAISLS